MGGRVDCEQAKEATKHVSMLELSAIVALKVKQGMSLFVKTNKSPSPSSNPSFNPKCWIGGLPDHVKQAPLCCLSIPGSHDSFTYSLTRSGTAGPDQPQCIRKLTKKFPRVSCWMLYNWSVTQGMSLTDQLERGVRYFDIRLDAVGENGEREFRVLHCLLGAKITDLLM